MIRSETGDKCSPKDLANEALAKCFENLDQWVEDNMDTIDNMTERELTLFNEQVEKQSRRVFKLLGMKEFGNHSGEEEQL